MILKKYSLGLFFVLAFALAAHAQNVKGRVVDAETKHPINDVSIVLNGTDVIAGSDESGAFALDKLKPGKYTVVITHAGHLPYEQEITVKKGATVKMDVELKPSNPEGVSAEIPTVTLDEADAETEGVGEVANLLHASRDVFQTLSGYGWSPFRFRERGYNNDEFELSINGITFNDPESGGAFYSEFGGLNDVLRNRSSSVGLDATDFTMGELGGSTLIDTRASVQRKQIRASYAISNRLYRNRVMLTANTGLMPNGWAVSASAGKRWAQEGYVEGTFYDAYSYFLSVDKKFGSKHGLNLTFLGAPSVRGRNADSFDEMYAINGNNYYNPLWGYQNGEKRNSQVASYNQPIGILRYDWAPSSKSGVTASAYTQFGSTGFTRLNWLDGGNPAPDYNRRLPSSLEDPDQAALWTQLLTDDKALRQINWDGLYLANYFNKAVTIEDAEGIAGNSVTGKPSTYIVENNRTQNLEIGANVFGHHAINDRIMLNGGLNYQWYKGGNNKVIDDLLGGDFWTDYDFFGLFDSPTNTSGKQSDLLHPNNLVHAGEVFGFDYDENIRNAKGWAQTQITLPHIQFFVGAELGHNTLWRTGNMQNGRFPTSSLGDSEKLNFNTYALKGGGAFKINGRNYFYANAYVGTRAPYFRDAFLSPRLRNLAVPDLNVSGVQSIEGGYMLRAPYFTARITGYYTHYSNETNSVFASAQTVGRVLDGIDFGNINLTDESFLEAPVFFGSAVLKGLDRRHTGFEVGVEAKPILGWTFSAALNYGQYLFDSRPDLLITLDNTDQAPIGVGKVYIQNFYIPRTPQTAAALNIKYEGKKFWFATATLNYTGGMYYSFDPLRRTTLFVDGQNPGSPIWSTIVEQDKTPSAYTIDLFGGKSWRIYEKYFINLSIGLNNVLDNQNIVISARESYRSAFRNEISDSRFYTSEKLYGFGRNYFINLGFRF